MLTADFLRRQIFFKYYLNFTPIEVDSRRSLQRSRKSQTIRGCARFRDCLVD
jgi:hypothetical protein